MAYQAPLRLSLSTGSLYVYPLRTVLRWARQSGFDGVELNVNPEAVLRGRRWVRRLAEEEGTPILSVHPPVAPIPGWKERGGDLGHSIALAQEVGAGIVILHVPYSNSLDEGEGRAFRQTIEAWQPRLAGGGVRLAVENKSIRAEFERRYALAPLDRLRAFADQHDLGLVLDTCHAALADEDLLSALDTFDGRLANVHLSDVGRSAPVLLPPSMRRAALEHRYPGDGRLPLQAFLQRLSLSVAHGYAGPLTLEVNPLAMRAWWPPAARRRVVRAAAWMRAALAQEAQIAPAIAS